MRSTIRFVGIVFACSLIFPAYAQQMFDTIPEPGDVGGESLSSMYDELVAAQREFFAVWNESNSENDFDIICARERPAGTRLSKEVCRPNYARGELNNAPDVLAGGSVRATGQSDTGGVSSTQDLQAFDTPGRTANNDRLLIEKMVALVNQDMDLRRSVERFATLQQQYFAAFQAESDQ